MCMNYAKLELFIEILMFSCLSSVVITTIIQKVKETIKVKSCIFRYVSMILSIVLGYLGAKCFTDYNDIYCIVSGILVYTGADIVYKSLESKNILSSIKSLEEDKVVKIPLENEIKGE